MGDVVLVAAALAVWATQSPLSTTEILCCFAALVVGLGLFVWPFAMEAFPQTQWLRLGSRAILPHENGPSVTISESDLNRQVRAATEAVEHAARANAALEGSARRFDARFAPLIEIHKNLEAVTADLREAASAQLTATANDGQATQREFERLRKEQAEKFKSADGKLTALAEALGVLTTHLKTLAERPVSAPKASVEPLPRAQMAAPRPEEKPKVTPPQVEEPALVAVASAPVDKVEAAAANLGESSGSNQVEVSGKKSNAGGSLLAKAMSTVQPTGDVSAVADIIQSRMRRTRKAQAPVEVVPDAAPVAGDESVAAAPAEAQAWGALAEGKFDALTAQVETETLPPAVEIATAAPGSDAISKAEPAGITAEAKRTARAKALSLRSADEEEKQATVVTASSGAAQEFTSGNAETAVSGIDGLTQGELLAREAETIRKRRSTKSPLNAATLVVRVLIGIGNKPYIRGEGPGLSLDKGVPMEFVEIGQWRWITPSPPREPISVRVYKNDEIPAEGEPIVLKPGQTLDVNPVFPAS